MGENMKFALRLLAMAAVVAICAKTLGMAAPMTGLYGPAIDAFLDGPLEK